MRRGQGVVRARSRSRHSGQAHDAAAAPARLALARRGRRRVAGRADGIEAAVVRAEVRIADRCARGNGERTGEG